MQNASSSGENSLGFRFSKQPNPRSPGYCQLDISLQKIPTEKHFDPEEVQINLINANMDSVQTVRIYHPWQDTGWHQAVAGRILMEDRYGKQEEAFTFGGRLSIENQESITTCSLTSKALILHPSQPNSIPWLLARLGQQFLAERRAAHLPSLEVYEHKLIQADPLLLYAVFLQSNEKRFEDFPHPHETSIRKIHYALQYERERMQTDNTWPMQLPSIEEIL